MQVLNNNPSAGQTISPNLPKPELPQSLNPKINPSVKSTVTPINNQTVVIEQKEQIPQLKTPVISQATPVETTDLNQATPVETTDENSDLTEEIGKKSKKKDKKSGKKKIPTILGLLILVVSLVAGIIFFGDGTGLFSPRATPETTPKNIIISNVTDKSFTVSFYTDEETIGFIKYGSSANDTKQQASDDRDQLSGVVKPYRLHQVTVRGLEANTNYFYLLGTGSKETFDDNGNPYQVKTASNPGTASPNNQTIYGTVSQANGQPGEGAIVFVTLEGANILSTLVKSSGSWAVSLANAFNLSLSNYPDISENSVLSIKVQGVEPDSLTERILNVGNAQPVPEIIMGQEAEIVDEDFSADRDELLADGAEDIEESEFDDMVTDDLLDSEEVTRSSLLSEEITVDDNDRTINLDEIDDETSSEDITVNSTQPIIKKTLPANTTVKIVINSDTTVETTAITDADGNVIVDLAELGSNLEPGDHTITYTYIDPDTGEEVTESYDFTVLEEATDYEQGSGVASVNDSRSTPEPTVARVNDSRSVPGPTVSYEQNTESETRTLASADTSSTLPHGTGDPYSLYTPTPSPIPTITPTEATTSARETVVSTESGTYNSGSIFNTLGLLMAGLFFLATGVWSFLLARQFEEK